MTGPFAPIRGRAVPIAADADGWIAPFVVAARGEPKPCDDTLTIGTLPRPYRGARLNQSESIQGSAAR